MKNRKVLVFVVLAIVVVGGIIFWFQKNKVKSQQVEYVTERAIKGTLISSVSASGVVSSSNYSSINTSISGIIKALYVKDGEEVKIGQKLAEIDLDQDGLQTQTKAYSSFLSAQNAVEEAKISKMNLESSLAQAKITKTSTEQSRLSYQKALETAQASVKAAQIDYQTAKNENRGWTYLEQKRLSLQAAENGLKLAEGQYNSVDANIAKTEMDLEVANEKLVNADNVIKKAQVDLQAAIITYNQSKSTITAPITGKISGLNIFEGMTINSQSSTSDSSSNNNQKLLTISNQKNPLLSVNISESDVSKIKVDQKANITIDSLPDKTFTGKVITIDRTGVVSSGVTTYPVTIQFDTLADDVLPNMSASANIIIEVKNDIVNVPSSAVKQLNNEYIVQVMINGKVEDRVVEVGLTSDTSTEIKTGINESEEVITSTKNNSSSVNKSSGNSTSVFGGLKMNGGNGNAVRIQSK